jgi:hypothetical protein
MDTLLVPPGTPKNLGRYFPSKDTSVIESGLQFEQHIAHDRFGSLTLILMEWTLTLP